MVVKFSVYLIRQVFVMRGVWCAGKQAENNKSCFLVNFSGNAPIGDNLHEMSNPVFWGN